MPVNRERDVVLPIRYLSMLLHTMHVGTYDGQLAALQTHIAHMNLLMNPTQSYTDTVSTHTYPTKSVSGHETYAALYTDPTCTQR